MSSPDAAAADRYASTVKATQSAMPPASHRAPHPSSPASSICERCVLPALDMAVRRALGRWLTRRGRASRGLHKSETAERLYGIDRSATIFVLCAELAALLTGRDPAPPEATAARTAAAASGC